MLLSDLSNKNFAWRIVQKAPHWAPRLAKFIFSIEHILRECSLWENIRTTWETFEYYLSSTCQISAAQVHLLKKDSASLLSFEINSNSPKRFRPSGNCGYDLSDGESYLYQGKSGGLYIPSQVEDPEMHLDQPGQFLLPRY